jgi:hypothetical protein
MTFVCRYEVKGTPVKGGFLSELHITDTAKSDNGAFTCIAKNPYGRAERVVHLQVQGMGFGKGFIYSYRK